MRVGSVVAVTACSASLVVLAQAPQTPVFRSTAILVPLTVTVLDSRGAPVTDLTAADFAVYENDQPREILSFFTQAMTGPRVAGAPAAANGMTPARRRRFLLVLGFGRIQQPGRGVDGALSLVRERLLPDDAVAVMAFHRTTEFTTNHQAVLAVLQRFKQHHERIVWDIREYFRRTRSPFSRGGPPLPAAMLARIDRDVFGVAASNAPGSNAPLALRDTVNYLLSMDRSLQVIDEPWQRQRSFADLVDQLDRAGWSLADAVTMSSRLKLFGGIELVRDLDGDKHVVVIAEDGIAGTADTARLLARRAAGARIAVHYIYTRGTNIRGSSGCLPCRDVTEWTGGQYTSVDYADQALARIDQATRFSYLLGYAPLDPSPDARYREVHVKVNRPGVVVQFARGYYASPEAQAAEMAETVRQTRVEAALAVFEPLTEIPVSIAVVPSPDSPGVLRVELAIDAAALSLSGPDDLRTGQLEIQVYCADRRETMIGSITERLDLKARPDTYARWLRDGFRHVLGVPVKGVPAFVKAVVFDFGNGRVGSRVVKIGRE
jgi:VWFA-related protein